MFTAKDPAESIVLTFDFSAIAASIANSQVTVEVVSGTDASAAAMRSGSPQIEAGKVLQRVVNGVDGADYRFRCEADSGSERLVITETLRVRKR